MPDAPDTTTRVAPAPVGETCRRSLDVTVTTAADGKRSTFTFMTGGLARDGMVVEPDGGQFDAYLRNPVVLWQHGYDFQRGNLPIGKGGNLTRSGDGWTAEVTWASDPFAGSVSEMVREGFLNAVSVGWRTLDAGWETRDGREVYVVRRWEMMEFSVVAVPADADALVTARAQDTNSLRAEVERLRAELDTLRAAPAPVAVEPAPEPTPEPEAPAPVVARALSTEETLAALLGMVPALESAYDRAMGRA